MMKTCELLKKKKEGKTKEINTFSKDLNEMC